MSTGPLPIEDPNGVFPILDGVLPVQDADVPPGFDLTQILSESMRARPQWRDFAACASRIIYEYVERTRLALQMSREPTVLARTLKIATLRMIGLDWNSRVLSDDDYDRILEIAAQYLQDHGPADFAQFMGYALGVPMQWVPLWTQDYATFTPGPSMTADIITVDPTSGTYPTAHGDLLYELFAPGADRVASIPDELTSVFDQIAPIHLVLDWIGAQITLSVGTLYLGTLTFDDGDDTLTVENPAVTVVTTQGAALIQQAQQAGTVLTITSAIVGSTEHDPQPSDVAVPDAACTVSGPALTSRPVVGAHRYYVTLGTNVGGFAMATLGLMSGTTLVAMAAFPILGAPKRAASPPVNPGDVRYLSVDVPLTGTDPLQ